MNARRLAASTLATLLLAGCGTTHGLPGEATPSPIATTPAPGFDVLVTTDDRAVTVHVGQKLEVRLQARPGMTAWSAPRSDNLAVVAPSAVRLATPPGVTAGGFEAIAAGTATISATSGPLCSPGQPCPAYLMLFSVAVTVLP